MHLARRNPPLELYTSNEHFCKRLDMFPSGGRIDVEARRCALDEALNGDGINQGSTLATRLPIANAPASDRDTDAVGGKANSVSTSLRVLVVDDNKDIVESTKLLLEMMNVNVRSAGDGHEALKVAEDFLPNIILLDIGMPEMDGLETARALRERPCGEKARLIAVTGWGRQEDIRRSMEAGFDDHIVKPMDPDALMDLLRRADSSG